MMRLRVTTVILLVVLGSAVSVCGQQAAKPHPYRLGLPGKDWALEIPLDAFYGLDIKTDLSKVDLGTSPMAWFTRPVETLTDDGRKYSLVVFRRSNEKGPRRPGHLTIRLEPALSPGSATALRDFALKTLAKENYVKSSSVKTWEHGQIPVARYTLLRETDGGNIYTGPIPRTLSGPRHVEAYFVKDDVWIRLTFTAAPYEAEEENLFNSLLDSVKFVDVSTPSSSFDYYHKGRLFFLNKDYAAAVQALQASFALEQRQRQLDIVFWRDLIGKLADSYGATMDRTRARRMLEYGIENDPANPTFPMGLARLYATEGDIDNTLAALAKAAASFKQAGAKNALPDLNYDPAFTRLMKVERFRSGVKALKK